MVSSSRRLKIGVPIGTFSLGHGLPGIDKYTYHLIRALLRGQGVEVLVFQEKYRPSGPFEEFDLCCFPILREWIGIKGSGRRPGGAGARGGGGIEGRQASRFGRFRREVVKSIYYLSKGVDVIHYPSHMESPLRFAPAAARPGSR